MGERVQDLGKGLTSQKKFDFLEKIGLVGKIPACRKNIRLLVKDPTSREKSDFSEKTNFSEKNQLFGKNPTSRKKKTSRKKTNFSEKIRLLGKNPTSRKKS